MIIDTHCHLDNSKYSKDLEEVIKRAIDSGVKGFLIPAADPDDLPKALKLAESYREIFFSAGTHPYDSEKFDINYLKEFTSHPKCIAIGECGLDYYRLPESEDEIKEEKKRQKDVFIKHIELAKEVKKPLIVHIREASTDSKEILKSNSAKEIGGVLHCYSADESLLSLAKDGFYFGIGGVITFKNAKKLINVFDKIPKDRLILETDSPYLTPHPYRGKRNEPSYINYVAQKVADLSDESLESIKELTTKNAKALFTEFYQLD